MTTPERANDHKRAKTHLHGFILLPNFAHTKSIIKVAFFTNKTETI